MLRFHVSLKVSEVSFAAGAYTGANTPLNLGFRCLFGTSLSFLMIAVGPRLVVPRSLASQTVGLTFQFLAHSIQFRLTEAPSTFAVWAIPVAAVVSLLPPKAFADCVNAAARTTIDRGQHCAGSMCREHCFTPSN